MDDYIIDGDLAFSSTSSALKFYREQYHKKKEWVGLTDDDFAIWKEPAIGILRWAEATLKERNT